MSTIGALAVGFRAARDAKRQDRAQRALRAASAASATVRVGMATLTAKLAQAAGSIIGLGCMTAAAWTVALPLGLLAAGVSAFVLEWRMSE